MSSCVVLGLGMEEALAKRRFLHCRSWNGNSQEKRRPCAALGSATHALSPAAVRWKPVCMLSNNIPQYKPPSTICQFGAGFGQFCAKKLRGACAALNQDGAEVGQIRRMLPREWPNVDQTCPDSGRVRPNLAKFVQTWPGIGQRVGLISADA